MDAQELRQWIERRGLSHEEAARLLALSIQGLRKQLYGVRRVGPQTERIVALIDRLGGDAHGAAKRANVTG
jgi:hypothetical protein